MKTFLNVLYRRILYKIPLKLLLILLAVFGVLFACFSNADSVSDFILPSQKSSFTTASISSSNYTYTLLNGPLRISSGYSVCVSPVAYHTNSTDLGFFACSSNIGSTSNLYEMSSCDLLFEFGASSSSNYDIVDSNFYCYYINSSHKNFGIAKKTTGSSSQLRVSYTFINSDSLSFYFRSGYIEESSIDSQYCVSNNLCPSNVLMTENQCKSIYGLISSNSCPSVPDCPVVPSGTGNLTQLYINNILHVGAPTILMNIPDEIDWDYAYTQGGNIMNIDIVGYNVDYKAVEDEIVIQKYKPNSEELSGIISGIIPLFVPGLCIILLLYFIFKFIKKVF